MCSVTLKPEQTVPAVRVSAVPQQFTENIMGIFQASAWTLLIFGFRFLSLNFGGKGAAHKFQMQAGSEEKRSET